MWGKKLSNLLYHLLLRATSVSLFGNAGRCQLSTSSDSQKALTLLSKNKINPGMSAQMKVEITGKTKDKSFFLPIYSS